MKIKVWGCRGSISSPGPKTVRYGGNTTCIEVRLSDNTLIIIDAGSGIRELGKILLKEQDLTEIYLFITHAHWDHLIGFPFFRLSYMDRYRINVLGCNSAQCLVQEYMEQQMTPPYFPVPFGALSADFTFTCGAPEGTKIGPARIINIPLNHPNGGCGLKIVEDDKVFVFLTDNELDFQHEGGMTKDSYADFSRGANLLMHDAQYIEQEYQVTRGWGHSIISSAVELSIEAHVERLGLTHHDPDHSDDDIDDFVVSSQEQISGANSSVDCFGVREGMEIIL